MKSKKSATHTGTSESNGDQPVTQGEFQPLMTAIKAEFNQLREEMASKEQLGHVLEIVQSIDARLKEWRDIPERMANVETDVFKLKVKRK